MKKILNNFIVFLFLSLLLILPISNVYAQSDNIVSDVVQDQVNLENLGINKKFADTTGQGRSIIYDWYVKDFKSEIVVNKDASLDITERIVADCGNLPDKHGIFRILPTFYSPEYGKKVKTPVSITSITDFNGIPYEYKETVDRSNGTITWKIGEADKTVTGENDYLIKYKVKNVIRTTSKDFDEFYWNLSGNFWDLEIDAFEANIVFPQEINENNTETYSYVGSYGINSQENIEAVWTTPNILNIKMNRGLDTREGVTTSVTFPKDIIIPAELSFLERNAEKLAFLWLIIPLITFLVCLRLFLKYGKDAKLGRSIAPEFEIPDKMNPMEMGTFLGNGSLNTKYISASIVDLAVRGYLKIEEVPKKGLLGSADTKFIWAGKSMSSLTESEKELLGGIFGGESEKLLSSLKNSFYKKIPAIKKDAFNRLMDKKLFEQKGFGLRDGMFGIAGLMIIIMIVGGSIIQPASPLFFVALVVTIVLLFFFGAFMTKRSPEGVELLGKVRGFEMFMKTAEKYRQRFNEKEGIFEKFLPYAMIFGITGMWVKEMKEMYGEEFFNNYHPIWYIGAFNGDIFDVDSFSSQLSALSSSMSSTMSSTPSSSGSGGGGFSGGGGGGGGGGGW